MLLAKHRYRGEARWSLDGRLLTAGTRLACLLTGPRSDLVAALERCLGPEGVPPEAHALAPVDENQEVWASGVTYLRSREARMAESQSADVYDLVYDAERPELFFKALGWRTSGHGEPIRVRRDSRWSVPEPELVLVLNAYFEVVGYTAGNDVSSRDIEGANPLYLPQAKVYEGACALGPGIRLIAGDARDLEGLPVGLRVEREGEVVFEGETDIGQMKRSFEELVECLGRELPFPDGVLLMTGTGIVPPEEFSLRVGDEVEVRVGELILANRVG